MARLPRALLALLLHLGVIGGHRRSSMSRRTALDPAVIGADLLVRAAGPPCDMRAAWRVMFSAALKPGWIAKEGSKGETPLMAAARAGCGEMVALIVLHPDFDGSTIATRKQRYDLSRYATKKGGEGEFVQWAVSVVNNIRRGRAAANELMQDPILAALENLWFLPRPGEWMPPLTLEQMQISLPLRPSLSEATMTRWRNATVSPDLDPRREARLDDIRKLWYLLVTHMQSPAGSAQRDQVTRHIRSIGWSLFFEGGRTAMLQYMRFIQELCSSKLDLPPDDAPVHEHLVKAGVPLALAYQRLHTRLGTVWNKTGDFLLQATPSS